MIESILSMLRYCIDSVSSWFLSFMNTDDNMFSFLMSFITIFLFGRFILRPLFGQRWGSDPVRPEPERRRIGFGGGDTKRGNYK